MSRRCLQAMRALVAVTGDLDPFSKGPPSGQGAQLFESDIADTLTQCKSTNEWLTAAHESRGRTTPGVSPEEQLARFCGDRFTDRPRIIPLDAPSCVTAPTELPTSLSARGAGASFLGSWPVHGAQLRIGSNTSGVTTSNCGSPCVESDELALSASPTGTRMTATITKITFSEGNSGKAIPNPTPGDSNRVGDSFYLEFVAPHLLRRTIIRSSLPAIDQTRGNPYWCGTGLSPSLRHFCGA